MRLLRFLDRVATAVFVVAIAISLLYQGLAGFGLTVGYRSLLENWSDVWRHPWLVSISFLVPLVVALVIFIRQRARRLAGTWDARASNANAITLICTAFGSLILFIFPFIFAAMGGSTSYLVGFWLGFNLIVGTMVFAGIAWGYEGVRQYVAAQHISWEPTTRQGFWVGAAVGWAVGAFFIVSLIGVYLVSHTLDLTQWALAGASVLILIKSIYYTARGLSYPPV